MSAIPLARIVQGSGPGLLLAHGAGGSAGRRPKAPPTRLAELAGGHFPVVEALPEPRDVLPEFLTSRAPIGNTPADGGVRPVMRIGELSRLTGVSTRLLRYYEEQGLLRPDRTAAGYREYGKEDSVRVWQIRSLLAAGLSTRIIAVLLPCATGPVPVLEACPQLLAILRDELADLDSRIEDLTHSRRALSHYLATAHDSGHDYGEEHAA
ncbi:MerR family transcriptional regulator [Kitasatospora sp. NPDC057542]|uniref:MerR family transcriptional regulator n=1 Tax=Kitasatospora sp. NPDC057542 TaxID=3346162 RepID=UPI0036C66D77